MSTITTFDVFKDEAVEAAARGAIELDEPRALLEKFATLVRESGTADEEAGPATSSRACRRSASR